MIYSNIIEKVFLPISDVILNSKFVKNYNLLKQYCSFSEKQLIALQQKKLKDLLNFASENSKYYRDLQIEPDSDPIKWLKRFPILEKETLGLKRNDILTRPKEQLTKHASSGSTGIQSIVYLTKNEESIPRATQVLWWNWAGYNLGDPLIQTGINPNRGFVKSIKDALLRVNYISAFAHSEEQILSVLKKLSGTNHYILGGYPSSLYVIAQTAQKYGFSNIKFKTTITWGDKLFDHYKKLISETFETSIYETYGCAEGLLIAAQKDLDYMYIMSPNVYLEILDEKGNDVSDGKMGQVVLTHLDGYSMPMIRYKIGDIAIKLEREKYPDQREFNFPLLQKVVGRETDIVKTYSGKTLTVHSFTGVFEHIPQIKQFCVVQTNLSGIVIQYIKGLNFYPELLGEIRTILLDNLKENFEISFEEVTEIKPTKSGKPQLVISKLVN